MKGLLLFRSPRALAGAIAIASAVLGGCSNLHADLVSDTYAAAFAQAAGKDPDTWKPDVRLVLDLDASRVTFTIGGADQGFALGERDTQGGGCDGNYDEEWVKVDTATLTIEGVTFHDPVLIASCPAEPRLLALAEGTGQPPYASELMPFIAFEPR